MFSGKNYITTSGEVLRRLHAVQTPSELKQKGKTAPIKKEDFHFFLFIPIYYMCFQTKFLKVRNSDRYFLFELGN